MSTEDPSKPERCFDHETQTWIEVPALDLIQSNGRQDQGVTTRQTGPPAETTARTQDGQQGQQSASRQVSAAGSFLGGVAGGFAAGLQSSASGLFHSVAHPMDTLEAMVYAVLHPVATGRAAWGAFESWAQAAIAGNPNALGRGAAELVPLLLGMGVTRIGKGAHAGRVAAESVKIGSFSISSWKGYPMWAPRPSGPFWLRSGVEYTAARKAANEANAALRRADPAKYAGKQIHEIHPVKFGGSPTDLANKIALTPVAHAELTKFWNELMRYLQ